jgi:tetratricopeptide (TPR) repeat protein
VISFQGIQFTLNRRIRKLVQMRFSGGFSVLVLSLTLGVFNAAVTFADTPSKGDLFEQGLAAYQNKQYAEARDAFQKQLDQGKETPALLNNLALSVFELDQKPLALALWRKALTLNPGFKPAQQGRDFLEKKMNMRPLERDSLSLWIHRTLESIAFYELLWVNALILAIAGWFGLKYLGERRFALEEEQPMPPLPVMSMLFVALFCAISVLSLMKWRDTSTDRATITAAKASVRSLPADEGVDLFDLSGGAEVYVRRQRDGWVQIQNVDGTSGWVKSSELLVTSKI